MGGAVRGQGSELYIPICISENRTHHPVSWGNNMKRHVPGQGHNGWESRESCSASWVIKEINGKSMKRILPDPKARMKSDDPTGCEHETSTISYTVAGSTAWGDHVWEILGPCLVQLDVSIPYSMHLHSWASSSEPPDPSGGGWTSNSQGDTHTWNTRE